MTKTSKSIIVKRKGTRQTDSRWIKMTKKKKGKG